MNKCKIRNKERKETADEGMVVPRQGTMGGRRAIVVATVRVTVIVVVVDVVVAAIAMVVPRQGTTGIRGPMVVPIQVRWR